MNNGTAALAGEGSFGWSIVQNTKGLWVQSPVGAHMGDK